MKPEEYLTYFEDFIFITGNLSAIALAKAEEFGQRTLVQISQEQFSLFGNGVP